MTDEARENRQLDAAWACATRLAREKCLKAVDDEPELQLDTPFLPSPYVAAYNIILRGIKANIRKRIEER